MISLNILADLRTYTPFLKIKGKIRGKLEPDSIIRPRKGTSIGYLMQVVFQKYFCDIKKTDYP